MKIFLSLPMLLQEILVEETSVVNWWKLAAIIEAGVILLLIVFMTKKTSSPPSLENKNEVNFDNIIQSSFHSEALYNKLKIKCHPDRFPLGTSENEMANELFQRLSFNRNNLEALKSLEVEIQEKLF